MRPWSYVNDAIAKTKLCITVIQVLQHICQVPHRITQLSNRDNDVPPHGDQCWRDNGLKSPVWRFYK